MGIAAGLFTDAANREYAHLTASEQRMTTIRAGSKLTPLVVAISASLGLSCGRTMPFTARDGPDAGQPVCTLTACVPSRPLGSGFVTDLTESTADTSPGDLPLRIGQGDIAFDELDRPVVASIDHSSGGRIVVRRFEQGRWVAIGCDFDGAARPSSYVRLASDRAGHLALTWVGEASPSLVQIEAAELRQDGWRRLPSLQSRWGTSGFIPPRVAISNGAPVLAWSALTPKTSTHVVRWSGSAWEDLTAQAPEALLDSVYDLVEDPKGRICVVGERTSASSGQERELSLSCLDTHGWVEQPFAFSAYSSYWSIGFDADGVPLISWTDQQPRSFRTVPALARLQGTMLVPLPPVRDGSTGVYRRIRSLPNRRPVVLQEVTTGSEDQQVMGAVIASWNGSAWDTLLDNVEQPSPFDIAATFDLDSRGRPAAIWLAGDGNSPTSVVTQQVWQESPSCW